MLARCAVLNDQCGILCRKAFFSILSCGEPRDRIRLPKDLSYYSAESKHRHYYYVMDTRGQVFLEETERRNIATSMKDVKFLNFLFRKLGPNPLPNNIEYPYLSYCGSELNFLCPEDPHSAVVFKDLVVDQLGELSSFEYGGNLTCKFDPSQLLYSPSTGRMYHKIDGQLSFQLSGHLGLLHPHLCQRLCAGLTVKETETGHSVYSILWNNLNYAVGLIPQHS